MKVMVRKKSKKLLSMNARNLVIFEVSVPNSNLRTREQRKGERPLKLLGMTLPNRRRKRSKKKWPTFASWLLKMKIRYHQSLTHLVIIIINVIMTMMMMMIMMMMIMRFTLRVNLWKTILAYFLGKSFTSISLLA